MNIPEQFPKALQQHFPAWSHELTYGSDQHDYDKHNAAQCAPVYSRPACFVYTHNPIDNLIIYPTALDSALPVVVYQIRHDNNASTSAFQRAFKRWTGMTPGDYRR